MKRTLVLLFVLICAQTQAADRDSWKMPLCDKARILEKLIEDRHNIDGLYPSIVRIEKDGSVDVTTTGDSNVAHSVSWTSYYLCGEVLRDQLTQDPAVHERVKEIWHSVQRLHTITGVPGLMCRGYVKGHGPSYEERADPLEKRWRQGQGDLAEYRYRGQPSHHTYSGTLRALGMVYDFIEDETCRDEVREVATAIGRYAFLDNDMTIRTEDGDLSCTLLLWPPAEIASTRGFMILGELTVIYHITQDPAIKTYMDKVIDRFQIRSKWSKASVEEIRKALRMDGGPDHDDSEHCFGHLYNLMRIEKDPELREYYLKFADVLWETMKEERQPIYNFIYETIRPGQGRIEDGLWWLRHYPTNRLFQPRMNSLRKDLPVHPLPLSERPFDNEYDFKGNPHSLDGWLARTITDVQVSASDPAVMYACDEEGYFYRSLDSGNAWEDSYLGLAGAKVKRISVSQKRFMRLAVATDQGAYWSWDSGARWSKLGDETTGRVCHWIRWEDGNPERVRMLTDQGVFSGMWQRKGFPEWEKLASLPCEGGAGLLCSERDREIFLAQGSQVWRMNQDTGQTTTLASLPEEGMKWEWLSAGSGPWIYAVAFKEIDKKTRQRAAFWSEDDGRSWRMLKGLTEEPTVLMEDSQGTVYLAGVPGLWASRDQGRTWEDATQGLDIPVVRSLISCSVTGTLYAGTPAGLYGQAASAPTWTETSLVPQFEGCLRRECGPEDFLYAYWIGKYHGFITEEMDKSDAE